MGNRNNAKPCTRCGHLKGEHHMVTVSRREVRLRCLTDACGCPKYLHG